MVDCVEYGIFLNYGGRFIRDPTLRYVGVACHVNVHTSGVDLEWEDGFGCVSQEIQTPIVGQNTRNCAQGRIEEDVNGGDEYIDVPWLTNNEDEEWQAARTQYKDSVKLYGDDADIDRALFDPTEAFVDDGLSDSIDSNDEVSFVPTSDDSEAEEARRRQSLHKVFDDSTVNLEFEVGMIFLSRKQFKDVVLAHSIDVKMETILKKNDKKRVRAVCADNRCNWALLLSIDARHFIKIRGILATTLSQINVQEAIHEELYLEITISQATRTKLIIVREFQGNCEQEYKNLFDYRLELLKKNPTSTFEIDARKPTPDSKLVFLGFYVCFATLREGFIAGCRPILGLDGAFLKGPCKGQLLFAVGRDANNQMYPIAWAIVEGESTSIWTWFLEFLNHDLKIGDGEYYTFVSDQQKNLFPKARRRRCARYIYANFRKEHKGKALQRWFWITTKSTNEAEFKRNLEGLNKLKLTAKDYVMKLDPNFWCKAFFDTYARCDVIDNNMTEAFNGFILDARHKGPLSLLEDLRRKCSKRNIEKLEFVEKKFKGMPEVDPPIPKNTSGRPKKKRHLEEWENTSGSTLSRKGRVEDSSINAQNQVPLDVQPAVNVQPNFNV
ncbi:hypothetical protein SLEP1_g37311 [Rubroshorea leprosula]|uniref:Transposase n=1 Tax=Rubroshorea leprosula TaxID=152421 RepID=A0AAV5KUC9_9ROSI|nr:hypothetical protein SLEP1_g37311 [Rubroshorea leprosula]